jgi:4-amino-4-deoxy-L-arabinose transferase-like glycosyltransferase
MIYRKQITKSILFLGLLIIRIIPVLYFCRAGRTGVEAVGEMDALLYLSGAREILATGTNQFNFFPPLNFLFIAACLYFAHGAVIGPLLALAILGWLTVIGIYLLTKDLFGEKTAIIAAIIGGIYPDFIFYCSTFYPETLAIFFMVFSFLMLVKYFYNQRLIDIVLGGILWGLASLTRGGLHYFSIVIALSIFASHFKEGFKFSLKPAVAFFLVTYGTFLTLASIIPETQGSTSLGSKSGIGSIIHGANRLIVCSTDYGNVRGNIFYDINKCKEEWPAGSQLDMLELFKLDTPQMYLKIIEFIVYDPVTYIKNSFIKLSNFWAPHPNPYLILYIKARLQKGYTIFSETACLMICLMYVIIVCGGLWGISIAKEPFRPIAIAFIMFYCIMIFLTVGNSKLRLPLMPFFIIYCSYFIACLQDGKWKSALTNRVAAILILIFLANSIYKYQEIRLSPAEILIQKIELCTKLGFPKTALYFLENSNKYSYTDEQSKRLQKAKALAHEKLEIKTDNNLMENP